MNINDIIAARPHWYIPEDATYVRLATGTGRPLDLYKRLNGSLFYLMRPGGAWIPSTFGIWEQERWVKANLLLPIERKQSINERLMNAF